MDRVLLQFADVTSFAKFRLAAMTSNVEINQTRLTVAGQFTAEEKEVAVRLGASVALQTEKPSTRQRTQ